MSRSIGATIAPSDLLREDAEEVRRKNAKTNPLARAAPFGHVRSAKYINEPKLCRKALGFLIWLLAFMRGSGRARLAIEKCRNKPIRRTGEQIA